MRRVVTLTGTASPRPTPATAVLMPTTRWLAIGQSAARVARIEGGIGLDDVVDDASVGARAGRERTSECAHDARSDGARQSHRVADRHHELADAQGIGVAQRGRGEISGIGSDDGEIRQRVGTDDLEVELITIDEGGLTMMVARHHVGGGHEEPIRRDDHGAARALSATLRGPDTKAGDGWEQSFGHGGDDARVGVEGIVVRRRCRGDVGHVGHGMLLVRTVSVARVGYPPRRSRRGGRQASRLRAERPDGCTRPPHRFDRWPPRCQSGCRGPVAPAWPARP